MRKLAFLLFIAFSINAMGQDELTFEKYMDKFETYQTNEIKRSDFKKRLLFGLYAPFIPESDECNCYIMELNYELQKKIEKKDYIIAFVREVCSSYKNIPYADIMLLVYSKKGELIDTKVVARDLGLFQYGLEGTVEPFEITVEQPKVPADDTSDYRKLPKACDVVTSKYTVGKDGKIIEKVISTEKGFYKWNSRLRDVEFMKGDIPADYVEDEPIADFNKFIGGFDTISTNEFGKPVLSSKWDTKVITDYDELRAFINADEECDCSKYEFQFRPLKKIEKENYTIAFLSRDCDRPLKGQTYNENMLIVYTKDGEVIDKRVVMRVHGLGHCNVKGVQEPFELTVDQGSVTFEEYEKYREIPMPCNVVTTKYTVNKDGKIVEEVLWSGKGKFVSGNRETYVVKDK